MSPRPCRHVSLIAGTASLVCLNILPFLRRHNAMWVSPAEISLSCQIFALLASWEIGGFIKNIRLEHGESWLSVDNDVMYAAVWLTLGQSKGRPVMAVQPMFWKWEVREKRRLSLVSFWHSWFPLHAPMVIETGFMDLLWPLFSSVLATEVLATQWYNYSGYHRWSMVLLHQFCTDRGLCTAFKGSHSPDCCKSCIEPSHSISGVTLQW